MNLIDQRIVIVGGSSGIGLATAKAVLEEGGQVIIVGRSAAKLQKAEQELGGSVQTYQADVTKEEEMQHLFAQVGCFDHLAVTAAEGVTGNFLELDVAAAKAAFESKFWGQYIAAKYSKPYLRAGGSITFFSGALAQKPLAGKSTLAAINAAVEGLARALAVEVSPLRVNVVSPGVVETPFLQGIPEKQRLAYFQSTATSLPAKRIGRPEDIAQTVLYLIHNSFTTGTVIHVDGGHPLAIRFS